MNTFANIFTNWQKLGGAAGILFVILFVIGIGFQIDSPTHNDPLADIQEWFADNGERYIIGDYIIGLAMVLLFLPFLGALRNMLQGAEQGEVRWSGMAYVGGVLFLIVGGVISLFTGSLAYGLGVADGVEESLARTFLYVEFYTFVWLLPLVVIPFALGTSLIVLQTGVIWRWTAYLGLLVAGVAAIVPLALFDSDSEGALAGIAFIWFIALGVWILAVRAAMFTQSSRSSNEP